MKRRTDARLNVKRLIEAMVYTPVDWPWKTVRLERDSMLDFQQRSTSANVAIGELYHENSKLFPQMLDELAGLRVRADEVRSEFLTRRAAALATGEAVDSPLDRRWRELLTAVVETIDLELFYAVELRVVADDLLAIHEPVADRLDVAKQLSAAELTLLASALRVGSSPEPSPRPGLLLFLVGCFARNDVLFGARGYRRTLLEAGRVTQEIVRQAARLGLTVRTLYELIDRDVDAVLSVDGTEEGTLMAFEVGDRPDGDEARSTAHGGDTLGV